MAKNDSTDTLTYHLSNLRTYPQKKSGVKAGGAADAEVVREILDEFEPELDQETYDFDVIRKALDKLEAYYDPKEESELNSGEAYIYGCFVTYRMEYLDDLIKRSEM